MVGWLVEVYNWKSLRNGMFTSNNGRTFQQHSKSKLIQRIMVPKDLSNAYHIPRQEMFKIYAAVQVETIVSLFFLRLLAPYKTINSKPKKYKNLFACSFSVPKPPPHPCPSSVLAAAPR